MRKGLFKHKKTDKVITVNWDYNWTSNAFYARYLGREFITSGESPSIGKNWEYIGEKTRTDNSG